MSSNVLIGVWATGVWQDLFSPTNLASTTISGYAIQPSTLGRLNDLIGTCYSGIGYTGATGGMGSINFDVSPDVGNTELAILGQMFLVSYYNNLAMVTMGQGGSTIPWTSIAEGDSRIARVNASSIGKEYREMSKTAYEQLNYLVNAFRNNSQGANVPRTVMYYNIASPTWGDAYLGP